MLINTARAEIIAPGALERRLERGDLLTGLDVFDKEPLPQDSPLRSVPGVVLTPHVSLAGRWRLCEPDPTGDGGDRLVLRGRRFQRGRLSGR